MHLVKTAAAASALALLLAAPVLADDAPAAGEDQMMPIEMPEACRAAGMEDMGATGGMGGVHGDGEMHGEDGVEGMGGMLVHQRAMMRSMMRTHGPMMQGMMAGDPDMAFACGMIPHHQGAIDMAEIQLEHGGNEEMRELARQIIEAQEAEIETLLQWIEGQAD